MEIGSEAHGSSRNGRAEASGEGSPSTEKPHERPIDAPEVRIFSTGDRKSGAQLTVRECACECDQSTDEPNGEDQARMTEVACHESCRGKDGAADDVTD